MRLPQTEIYRSRNQAQTPRNTASKARQISASDFLAVRVQQAIALVPGLLLVAVLGEEFKAIGAVIGFAIVAAYMVPLSIYLRNKVRRGDQMW